MCGLCSLTTRWVCSDNFSDTEFSVLSFPLEPKKKRFSRCFSTLHLTDDISDMGDSGAWVVDAATGDLYGVIVAASTVMQEGYLIPASEITKDIQRATGVPTVKLPKRADFNHTLQYSKDVESIDGLFTAGAAVDYKNRHQITYDRQSRTDHEPRQPNAIQASHLDERQEETHSGNTIASHSQISETVLGKERPDTPASMNNLAVVLSRQGKYKEAEEMHRKVLVSCESVLGKEHPDMLASMNNLAEVLSRQGKYKAAEEMHQQTRTLREMVLGKEHPNTLISMNNLAEVLSRQGKYKEAEEINRQVLASSERVLGKEHPDMLASMNNLAEVLSRQGKDEEAEEMHRQVLALSERVLGKEHPNTLTNINNLAEVLSRQGKYKEAEEMHRQVLASRETVLGMEHPDTLTSVYCLAYLLHQEERYEDAKVLYHRAYAGYTKTLGENHPTTAACSEHYSSMLREEGLNIM